MYIRTFAGFGLAEVRYNSKYSGRDYWWSDSLKSTRFVARPPFVGGNIVERQLKIPFSADWPTFRERLKKAFGRFMVFRSDAGRAVDEEIEAIAAKTFHEKLVVDRAGVKDFVVLRMRIFYLKRASGDWILNNFSFPETWQWE
jgi:hypothetical protein